MADEREILKYQLDVSDVEAKVARVNQLTASITEGRARGEDTSVLEQQLGRELDAMGKIAPATKKAGDEMFDFDRKGEKAAKSILGLLNPSLAQAVDLLIDVGEGAAHVSGSLAAMAGVGALLGGIVTLFERMKRQAEEAKKAIDAQLAAMAKLREAGAAERQGLVSELAALGVSTAGGDEQRTGQRFGRVLPGREDLARNIAVAQGIATANKIDFDPNVFLAGLSSTGFKPAAFEAGDAEANVAMVRKILAAGATPSAAQLSDTFERSLRGGLDRPAIDSPSAVGGRTVAPLDDAAKRVQDLLPNLTEDNIRRLNAILERVRAGEISESIGSHGDVLKVARALGWVSSGNIYENLGREARPGEMEASGVVPGTNINFGDFLDAVRQAVAEAEHRAGGTGTRLAPTTQPVQFNVTVNQQNTGTMRVHAPEYQRPSAVPSVSKSPTGGG